MEFKIGQKVFWNDPDHGNSSGVYDLVEYIDDESALVKNEVSEAEVYLHELMHLDDVYVCRECNSTNIEELMWCTVNQKVNVIADSGPYDQYYCNDCDKRFNDSYKNLGDIINKNISSNGKI
jgi:DNA-directed RNA polymerase subunit RPC12/RpoP